MNHQLSTLNIISTLVGFKQLNVFWLMLSQTYFVFNGKYMWQYESDTLTVINQLWIAVCNSRMYGVNCSQKCGACLDNEACHHTNGTCLNGCDKGYHSRKCDKGILSFIFSIVHLLDKFSPLNCHGHQP